MLWFSPLQSVLPESLLTAVTLHPREEVVSGGLSGGRDRVTRDSSGPGLKWEGWTGQTVIGLPWRSLANCNMGKVMIMSLSNSWKASRLACPSDLLPRYSFMMVGITSVGTSWGKRPCQIPQPWQTLPRGPASSCLVFFMSQGSCGRRLSTSLPWGF